MLSLLLFLWHDCYLVNNLFLTRSEVCSTKGHLMTWSSPRPGAVIGSRKECPIAILLNGNTAKMSSKYLTFILIQLTTFYRGQGNFYNFFGRSQWRDLWFIKHLRIRDIELSPKWNIYFNPSCQCPGTTSEEEMERVQEPEDCCEIMSSGHISAITSKNSQQLWLPT